jgi:hypothetical protein
VLAGAVLKAATATPAILAATHDHPYPVRLSLKVIFSRHRFPDIVASLPAVPAVARDVLQ